MYLIQNNAVKNTYKIDNHRGQVQKQPLANVTDQFQLTFLASQKGLTPIIDFLDKNQKSFFRELDRAKGYKKQWEVSRAYPVSC